MWSNKQSQTWGEDTIINPYNNVYMLFKATNKSKWRNMQMLLSAGLTTPCIK